MDKLTLRFTGADDLKPQTLRAKELADVIKDLENAVASTVVDTNSAMKKEQIAVSLVEVTNQSVGLTFAPNLPQLTFPALFRISEAFLDRSFGSLPQNTRKSLKSLARFVRKYDCVAQLDILYGTQDIKFKIDADTHIDDPSDLRGDTVLYGRVIKAGGVDPKVEFRPINGKTLFCSTTEKIAVQLASRLYQKVGVDGEAVWDTQTAEIKSFHINKVTPYTQIPLTEAFDELKEAFDGSLDHIEDVNGYINQIRYGDQ